MKIVGHKNLFEYQIIEFKKILIKKEGKQSCAEFCSDQKFLKKYLKKIEWSFKFLWSNTTVCFQEEIISKPLQI